MPYVTFNENEEQRLVRRLQEGDESAAREFYALYANSLAGVCSRYIADEDDMKDVFQNAFLQIFSHIGDFEYRKEGSLEAWATKVMVNESLKFLKTRKQHELLKPGFDVADEGTDDLSISDIPPDVILQMLSRLPTGYRTVLNLYVFEGKSHQEIASLLGIKKDSSASQLHKAKQILAKMLRKYNDNNTPRR